MKRIENLNVRSVRTQGIVRDGGIIRMSTAWFRPAAWLRTAADGSVHSPRFFLPVAVLKEVFRGKFTEALQQAFETESSAFYGTLKPLGRPKVFAALIRQTYRKDWVVYCKRPFGGAEHVLRYLGCYTHRVAISNHRLVSLADGKVTFRWRDSAHKNKKRLMTLPVEEFLRRFLLACTTDDGSFVFGTSVFSARGTGPCCFRCAGNSLRRPTAESAARCTNGAVPSNMKGCGNVRSAGADAVTRTPHSGAIAASLATLHNSVWPSHETQLHRRQTNICQLRHHSCAPACLRPSRQPAPHVLFLRNRSLL